jgi:hypothetical protein
MILDLEDDGSGTGKYGLIAIFVASTRSADGG